MKAVDLLYSALTDPSSVDVADWTVAYEAETGDESLRGCPALPMPQISTGAGAWAGARAGAGAGTGWAGVGAWAGAGARAGAWAWAWTWAGAQWQGRGRGQGQTANQEKNMKTNEKRDPCRIGNAVLILTPSYHWTGKIVEVTPFGLVLEDAMVFVETGLLMDAQKGEWKNAHGDPLKGYVKVPAPPSSQVMDYFGELPRERLAG